MISSMLIRLFQKLGVCCTNLRSLFLGLLYGRSQENVIIGAWMGEKFADNSRFLFQYLSDNKQKYGLKNVIWATRNSDVHNLLTSMGYQSCLIGSKDSDIWHLKSGVHILCNTAFPLKKYGTDIDTKFSYGANKIQLWHGVGFKAVGMSSNEAEMTKTRGVLKKVLDAKCFSIFQSLGGWTEAMVVATSPSNGCALQKVIGCRADRILLTGYPRHCQCPKLLPHEEIVIKRITTFKTSILYLPTFRTDVSKYYNPLDDKSFVEFLNSNDILWIEKPHSADLHYQNRNSGVNNYISLDSDFDINVVYSFLTVVMSDYSSAIFDAIRLNIPVIMYTPDIDIFKNGDVGFLFDVEDYCKGLLAYTPLQCATICEQIVNGKYFNSQRLKVYKSVIEDFFSSSTNSMDEIWNAINEA